MAAGTTIPSSIASDDEQEDARTNKSEKLARKQRQERTEISLVKDGAQEYEQRSDFMNEPTMNGASSHDHQISYIDAQMSSSDFKIIRSVMRLPLAPVFAGDPLEGVRECLESWIMRQAYISNKPFGTLMTALQKVF